MASRLMSPHPGPINDPEADWLWHTFLGFDADPLTAASASALGVIERIEIDSKAMRKIQTDHVVVLIGESNTGDFAAVNVTGGLRLLFGS